MKSLGISNKGWIYLAAYMVMFVGLWIATSQKVVIFNPLIDMAIQCVCLLSFVTHFLFRTPVVHLNKQES